MKQKIQIILMCIIGGLLLAFLFGRHEWKRIETTPDSRMYHFLAVNMMQGKGYYMRPIGSVEDYNAQTIEKFGVHDVTIVEKPSMNRMPGYPFFLMLIYSIHGIDIDAVLPYQLLLTGLTGALMVLAGWFMLGRLGAVTALVAVLVFGVNNEAAYPTFTLLSGCLAMFLLTSAAAAAAWAQKGGWKREFIASLLIILAIFTRPASIFIAIPYGIILIIQYYSVSKKRLLVFIGLCGILLLSWSIFASSQAGRFIPLTSNGKQIMYAGLDPVETAKKLGVNPPKINVTSLKQFWKTFAGGPGLNDISVLKLLASIPGRLSEVIKIEIIKLKAGTDWLLRSLLACMLLGVSLIGCIQINIDKFKLKKDVETEVYVKQRGLIRSNRLLEMILLIAALLVMVVALGFSTTIIQLFFWLLPAVALFFRLEFTTEKVSSSSCHHWILSWYWGYILMCLITVSHPRLIRPFLPILYLCAAIAIPMLAMMLLGLKQGKLKLSKRIYLKFVRVR